MNESKDGLDAFLNKIKVFFSSLSHLTESMSEGQKAFKHLRHTLKDLIPIFSMENLNTNSNKCISDFFWQS